MEDSKVSFHEQRPGMQAEMAACHVLLAVARSTMKWAQVLKLIGHWFAVLAKLKPEPQPVMLNAIKEQEDKKNAAKAEPIVVVDNVVSMNEPKE